MSEVICSRALHKSYDEAGHSLKVLNGIDFTIMQGETAAVLGVSGSGKSTFLHLLGGLDKPTEGNIYWNGQDIHQVGEKEKCLLRNKYLGFVYQFHHLLPEFTAFENVAMPLLIGNNSLKIVRQQVNYLLKQVGLLDRAAHKIGELSGGERQRIAIARALVTQPKCVLADEPTGNLDAQTAQHILSIMFVLQEEFGTSFVIATHDIAVANAMKKCYILRDGILLTERE